MMAVSLAAPEWRLLVALAIGLLVGTERQRRSDADHPELAAGIRTHALIALLGGVAALAQSLAVTIAAAGFVFGTTLVGYARSASEKPGQTSEVAAVATFALGYLALSMPRAAIIAGLAMTILLAARAPLHAFVQKSLTRRDLLDGLTFLVAALVILPIVPDRAIDPWGLVNPYALWRLAVVLMGLSALGYVAQRSLGPRFGLIVAGFVGGFVSTTVTIAAMGTRSRNDEQLVAPVAAGALAAMLGAITYLFALLAVANWPLTLRLLPALGGALLPTLGYALFLARRGGVASDVQALAGRAFDARLAIFFAGLVAIFALVGKFLTLWLGSEGFLAGAFATGLVDVHATAVSIAALGIAGTVTPRDATMAVVIAATANMAIKVPAGFAFGGSRFGWRVSAGLLLLVAGMWGGHAAGLAWGLAPG
jgi:uncharacterized membrane protein (DUF4010 family)